MNNDFLCRCQAFYMFWLYQDSILQYFYEGFVYCDISHSGSSLFWLYQDSILQLTWTQCRLPSHARIVVGMLSTTVYSSLVHSISYTMVYHVLWYIATSAPMGCQLEKSSQSSCHHHIYLKTFFRTGWSFPQMVRCFQAVFFHKLPPKSSSTLIQPVQDMIMYTRNITLKSIFIQNRNTSQIWNSRRQWKKDGRCWLSGASFKYSPWTIFLSVKVFKTLDIWKK